MLAAGMAGAQTPAAGHGPYFPADAPWYQDVSASPVDGESAAVISWLAGVGGWGGGHLQIDFSIEVLEADATTPLVSFTPTADFYTPDCDLVPDAAAGRRRARGGEPATSAPSDGDCHLLVVHRPSHRLYEMWRANHGGRATSTAAASRCGTWT